MDNLSEDEIRRRREINMFASFALAGEEPIAGFDVGENSQQQQRTEENNDNQKNTNKDTEESTKLNNKLAGDGINFDGDRNVFFRRRGFRHGPDGLQSPIDWGELDDTSYGEDNAKFNLKQSPNDKEGNESRRKDQRKEHDDNESWSDFTLSNSEKQWNNQKFKKSSISDNPFIAADRNIKVTRNDNDDDVIIASKIPEENLSTSSVANSAEWKNFPDENPKFHEPVSSRRKKYFPFDAWPKPTEDVSINKEHDDKKVELIHTSSMPTTVNEQLDSNESNSHDGKALKSEFRKSPSKDRKRIIPEVQQTNNNVKQDDFPPTETMTKSKSSNNMYEMDIESRTIAPDFTLGSRDSFLNDVVGAPHEIDTGTFTFATTTKQDSMEKSNLDAAVAALSQSDRQASDDSTKRTVKTLNIPTPLVQQKKNQQKFITEDIGMFSEEIVMPRPLFFGAIVPPRVLHEAKQMTMAAVECYRQDQQKSTSFASPTSPASSPSNFTQSMNKPPPRLHDLPLDVRNIIGALRTYGYGLLDQVIYDLENSSTSDINNSLNLEGEIKFFGTPYVSTFQPVWGSDDRSERVKAYRKQQKKLKKMQRPKQLTVYDRSITAPARFAVMNQSDEDDFDDDNDAGALHLFQQKDRKSKSIQQTPNKNSTYANVDAQTDVDHDQRDQPSPNQLFSNWIRNDDEPILGAMSGDSVSSQLSKDVTSLNASPNSGDGKSVLPTLQSKSWSVQLKDTFDDNNDEDDEDDNSDIDQDVKADSTIKEEETEMPMSEQELFSQWARGTDMTTPTSTDVGSISFSKTTKKKDQTFEFSNAKDSGTFNPMNTFQRITPIDRGDRDSDDGSVIDDEQKKQVGVNDHLSKAIALLADDELPTNNDVTTIEQSQVLLSQVASDGTRKRPLTNFELTSGCIPVFGIDDAPLPQEADLGIHETKEEQQRTQEQKRSQEIIEKFVAPNVFGPVACPNPATCPDDFHSWNSRTPTSPVVRFPVPNSAVASTTNDIPPSSASRRQFNSFGSSPSTAEAVGTPMRESNRSRSEGNSIDFGPNVPPQLPKPHQTQYTHRSYSRPPKHNGKKSGDFGISSVYANTKRGNRMHAHARSRVGWWSVSEDDVPDDDDIGEDGMEGADDNILQIPPVHHSAATVQIVTHLEPSPEKLRTENLPLSRMHAATSMEQSLPYLSDRPPSYRHVQIDTQTIAFPPIKGELEPLFCSVAIYNVETITGTSPTAVGGSGGSSTSGAKAKVAAIPNLQRCGRVTESLYFDHVSDDIIAKRCASCLYPHFKVDNGALDHLLYGNDGVSEEVKTELLQGTRCGVFPIPSNLNLANLYVVLIVRKVIADESDIEPYVNLANGGKSIIVDVEKHRAHAEKNSKQHGMFLMPFAFGVAPLLQVFGTDNPNVTSSRAVQIPLFLFDGKESQILDHIMVMLFPKASQKTHGIGGAAAVTNGGTAMLVMRNFGYFGLHTVIDNKSSLARDRVVDFTGELQIRRKVEEDINERHPRTKPEQGEGYKMILPDFRPEYICEPSKNGGRHLEKPDSKVPLLSASKLYAQELLPLPLQMSPSSRLPSGISPGMVRGQSSQDDIEPYFHTSFCNELLCLPRILHNCSKMNVVVKVELREVEWSDENIGYLAHLPSCGPSVHNNRRGPFLVQSSFTSCTSRRSHQFMDEFKVKLPLDLKRDGAARNLSLFFTIFKIKLGGRSRWKRNAKLLFGSDTTSVTEEHAVSGSTQLDQIACGFLPLTEQSCIVENGIHDVPCAYKAFPLTEEMCTKGYGECTTYLLKERTDDMLAGTASHARDDSCAEDATVSESSYVSELRGTPVSNLVTHEGGQDLATLDEDSQMRHQKTKDNINEQISMSVRIVVFSSLHSQNVTLNDFLSQETNIPRLSQLPNKVFLSKLRMGRDYLSNNTGNDFSHSKFLHLDERLMESTIAITDHQLCSSSRSAGHVVRIMSRLWQTLICGNGDPNLAWTNPGTSTPLRAHTFATIVHLVGATSLYLSKNGLSQLDGTKKWNVVSFGRVLALLFNEGSLFGSQAVEKFDETYWSTPDALNPNQSQRTTTATTKKAPAKRGRHFRNSHDLFNDIPLRDAPKPLKSEALSSPAGDLATPPQRRTFMTHAPLEAVQPELSDAKYEMEKQERKVDSKKDFQLFLKAANESTDEDVHKAETGNANNVNISIEATVDDGDGDGPLASSIQVSRSSTNASKTFVQAFGEVAGSRRWMPASNALLPIMESENGDESDNEVHATENDSDVNFSVTDEVMSHDSPSMDPVGDYVVPTTSKQTKQMRRPRIKPKQAENVAPSNEKDSDPPKPPLLIMSDDEIESKGTAFLADIGASIGMSFSMPNKLGEEDKAESANLRNRRHQNRSSIDWSLMSDNITVLNQPTVQEETVVEEEVEGEEEDDETMSTLKIEYNSYVKLPNFIDRLVIIGKSSTENSRWFPYVYEVIIMQWSAILLEQRKAGDKTISKSPSSLNGEVSDMDLSQAALRSVGVAVASAPMLFEVIKQSLGFRIHSLFSQILSKKGSKTTPPLVILDDTLMKHLEQVIIMVADACIDSRNFDSWELRQMSIDVNDAIARFLRDLFGFLAPMCVHRLILAHLSRFVTREGKHVSDRESFVGLRCSWEITKLRLNAVTALARFPEFIKINSPQMLNWSNWWTNSPSRMTCKFYDNVLDRYQALRLPAFAGSEESKSKSIDIPNMKPHWLAEILVDICLLGTEHAEQYIQHRSASILHELFWHCSQESILTGTSAAVSSMYITFLEKLLPNASYLANFSAKSQLRKDILLCAIFVMQSAPTNLLRALWRHLIVRMPGRDLERKYFTDISSTDVPVENNENHSEVPNEAKEEPNILGMFSVLNLALRTVEYEGCDDHVESDSSGENRENIDVWHKEYLLCAKKRRGKESREARKSDDQGAELTSSTSRKWQAHDGSIVIVNTCHHIVRELFTLLQGSPNGKLLLNPAAQYGRQTAPNKSPAEISVKAKNFAISKTETILFVRAATSVYLHALSLAESDVVFVRTLIFSAEVIKIFGISIFLEAVGETLQHWMRVISFHCGARRAQVRIEATDLLELLLRSTWECFGSFFRIRVPLLAVQTEVMERIVAIAASRYYREQRRVGTSFEAFSNLGAEASLVPLWRTLDRIQKQPASQNIAFRGALIRIARKLKKLYRAYVAARVLSFIKGAKEKYQTDENDEERDYKTEAIIRANRINILKVINASEGHSKQFLGFQGTAQQRTSVAHFEAVEDALIDAADVFSPTELPEHRVAWLRMLAEFHSGRKKHAEEAMCHYHIHVTLNLAARLHGSLWSNTPFLPWTDNIPDPVVYIDGDATATDPDCTSEFMYDANDPEYGKRMESANSFRRIFYRVANSIAMGNNEWDAGVTRNLFFGITFAYEYYTVSPWITLREMEENMAEEVEAAGHLFLSAGIIESSRFAWNLVALLHADKFNYAKLSNAYNNLSKAVVSQVPPIDTSLPQEVLATLGRFYRVWFHGGAPDDLSGVEFVYRTQGSVPLKKFGEELHDVIKSIIPDRAPIQLVLDGLSDERVDDGSTSYTGFSRIGPAPLEPVRIKVTPLRPLFETKTRGLPEWFNDYVDEAYNGQRYTTTNNMSQRGGGRHRKDTAPRNGNDPHHHDRFRSFSATIFSSTGSATTTLTGRRGPVSTVGNADRVIRFAGSTDSSLRGVDKFCFLQPRDRSKGTKEWWKSINGDFAEKSLKVTQLQVEQSFPACVARQAVVHRLVYAQSPLESGVDALCQWCAVLFRASVSTAGMAVLKTNLEPGIGTNATKVVADCIHGSRVKDIGLALLKKESESNEGESNTDFTLDYDRLSEDEVRKFQRKLSRLIITFIELLHLLIARNRDLLLSVIKERKKSNEFVGSLTFGSVPVTQAISRTPSFGFRPEGTNIRKNPGSHRGTMSDIMSDTGLRSDVVPVRSNHKPTISDDQQSYQSMFTATGVRTDSAIAVQSELQRSFVKLVKDLYPHLNGVLQSEMPRWLKLCTNDTYFSLGTYQQTKVRIAEELNFLSMLDSGQSDSNNSQQNLESHVSQSENGYDSPRGGSVAAGSQTSGMSRGSGQFAMN